MIRREWWAEEEDWRLLGNKSGTTRLGFGVLLKYFELEGRFPRHAGDVPRAATDYGARKTPTPASATSKPWCRPRSWPG